MLILQLLFEFIDFFNKRNLFFEFLGKGHERREEHDDEVHSSLIVTIPSLIEYNQTTRKGKTEVNVRLSPVNVRYPRRNIEFDEVIILLFFSLPSLCLFFLFFFVF